VDRWSLDLQSYSVSLNDITSNAEMNDWIFQLVEKTWVTTDDLGNLLLAFHDIFSPQATLCGMGRDKRVPRDYVNGVLGKPLGNVERTLCFLTQNGDSCRSAHPGHGRLFLSRRREEVLIALQP